jgi:hypothetical protein
VGKGRAHTNTKKRTKWKTLGRTFTTNYESLLDFKFPELSTGKVVTWQAHVDDKTSSKEAAYYMIIFDDVHRNHGRLLTTMYKMGWNRDSTKTQSYIK